LPRNRSTLRIDAPLSTAYCVFSSLTLSYPKIFLNDLFYSSAHDGRRGLLVFRGSFFVWRLQWTDAISLEPP